jgi:hypothetical protein
VYLFKRFKQKTAKGGAASIAQTARKWLAWAL